MSSGPADTHAFRLEAEKVLGASVRCMSWCPTMDLIAFATDKGDVHVHRLSWQKLWTASCGPPRMSSSHPE